MKHNPQDLTDRRLKERYQKNLACVQLMARYPQDLTYVHLVESYPPLLNEAHLSEILGSKLQTLRNNRSMKRGIPYIKVGRSVRYKLSDVIEYLEARKVETESI